VGVQKEAIEKLTRLQALDSQIRKMKAELEEKPRLMGAERKQLDDARAALAEAERKAKDAQKAADRKELDVRTKEDAIKKLDGQLNAATSNKVYGDLLLNIKSQRMDIEKMEEAILGMMDEVEALEGDVERARVVLRNAEEEFKEAEKVLRAQSKEIEERLAQKQGIRDLLAKEVDPEVLVVYDRVREARKGVGITAVDVDAEGSHFCSSCQINITLQDINVAMGGDRIVQCKSCNRILYVASLPEKPEGDGDA
jgi:predicted  nucleic acid-binding Zn-ribbon protein